MEAVKPSIPPEVLHEDTYLRNQVWDLFGQWNLFNGLFDDAEQVRALAWAYREGAAGLIHQAIRTELMVALGRLLDPATEKIRKVECTNLSLSRMIAHVETYDLKQSFGMRDELASLIKESAPLKRWRDKYHAHRDRAVAMNLDPVPLPHLDRETFGRVFSLLHKLTERICWELDKSKTPFPDAYGQAASQFLKLIMPRYRESQARLKKALDTL